ncbi:MAG: histidinol phosphate phosphatase domain-containing protein [Candidatus Omnitrophica bacterium]|nr:histidinol phosphate phosphatase domain-containing protein [Candidatus Omnitrophota bacterium]
MFNLHCHSLLSDGVLLPSELAMRYLDKGYQAIAITDHVDYSNIKQAVNSILEFSQKWPKNFPLKVLPGIELTHLPLEQFKPLSQYARKQGIKVIVAHGETLAEPVLKGTNHAALEADIDILAHPGLISDEDVKLAKKRGVFLEITSRKAHADTNGYVIERALKLQAKLILSTDSHSPEDIISSKELEGIAKRIDLKQKDIDEIYKNVLHFIREKEGR